MSFAPVAVLLVIAAVCVVESLIQFAIRNIRHRETRRA